MASPGLKTANGGVMPDPVSTGADVKNSSGGGGGGGGGANKQVVKKPVKAKVKSAGKAKTTARTSEYIEGNMSVLPNPDYECKRLYAVRGVGKLFSGNYYVSKVTHTISDSYEVSLETTMVQLLAIGNTKKDTRKKPAETKKPVKHPTTKKAKAKAKTKPKPKKK